MKTRLIIGLVVFVASMVYLAVYAMPNVFRAQEVQKQAQMEYDQAMLEQEQAMNEMNAAIDEVSERNDIH